MTTIVDPVQWVETKSVTSTLRLLNLASMRVEDEGLPGRTVITGTPGLGKTAVTEEAIARYYTARDRAVLRLTMTGKARGNELLFNLLSSLGRQVPARFTSYQLRHDLVDALRDVRSVVVIDEAHHLSVEPLREIKSIGDVLPRTDWILVGTDELAENLRRVPELNDRFRTRVQFARMTLDEVLHAVPLTHPLAASMPPVLITKLDQEYCEGRWRAWRDLIGRMVTIAGRRETPVPIEKLAYAAIASFGDWKASTPESYVVTRKRGHR